MKCACFCLFSIWLAAELNWNSLASINFKASWAHSAWQCACCVPCACHKRVNCVSIILSRGSPTWLSRGQVAVALCSVFVSPNHSAPCLLIASPNRLIVRIIFKLRSCLIDSSGCNLSFNSHCLSLCYDVMMCVLFSNPTALKECFVYFVFKGVTHFPWATLIQGGSSITLCCIHKYLMCALGWSWIFTFRPPLVVDNIEDCLLFRDTDSFKWRSCLGDLLPVPTTGVAPFLYIDKRSAISDLLFALRTLLYISHRLFLLASALIALYMPAILMLYSRLEFQTLDQHLKVYNNTFSMSFKTDNPWSPIKTS